MPSELALPSLEIHNFRGLKELKISRLGRANLIVGKNNVGKTSVLEALRLYAEPDSFDTYIDLLESRNELDSRAVRRNRNHLRTSGQAVPIEGLFFGRPSLLNNSDPIIVGEIGKLSNSVKLSFGSFASVADAYRLEPVGLLEHGNGAEATSIFALVAKVGDRKFAINVSSIEDFLRQRLIARFSSKIGPLAGSGFQFVGPSGLAPEEQEKLWDEITLTSLEDEIVAGIKRVIFPQLERLAFRYLEQGSVARIPFVKMFGMENPIPLGSMGDGVNRMLGMALAVANSKQGIVLIDEFENGLHYTVQTDIWRFLFDFATKLNVQVFATTHSSDCVKAFQEASAESEEEGVLIRLARKDDRILVAEFDERLLEIAVEGQVEVR